MHWLLLRMGKEVDIMEEKTLFEELGVQYKEKDGISILFYPLIQKNIRFPMLGNTEECGLSL